jgi:predicted nucleic acid-binding protein
MSDRAFIDANVFLYLYSVDEAAKQKQAESAMEEYNCVTSTQALNEFCNVCTKKWKLPISDIQQAIDEICETFTVYQLTPEMIKQALPLREKYRYSFYDCLMLSAALAYNCKWMLSEDMQDGQIIEGVLTIKNIFSLY